MLFRYANTNGKTVRKNNRVISIKDNIVVNSRKESLLSWSLLLEFGEVLCLALHGNYVGAQIAIILYAVFSYPWSFHY